MLQQTFCHLPGISQYTEQKMWRQGITHWDKVPTTHWSSRYIEQSRQYLKNRQFDYFNLPNAQQWRLFKDVPSCFIDIETTGLDKQNDIITTIACHDTKSSRVFVYGQDLDQFIPYIQQYPLIITFNGACFDIPFIGNFFNTTLSMHHCDLRYPLKRLGYSGGLKRIEHQLGLQRGDLDGVDGYEAVRLWWKYQKGDTQALERLKKYNMLDVINLVPLMNLVYDQLYQQEFIKICDPYA